MIYLQSQGAFESDIVFNFTLEMIDNCSENMHILWPPPSSAAAAELNKRLKCDICDKEFCSSYYLQNHARYTHSPDKRFKCDNCGKCFKAPYHLKLHVQRIHSQEKKHNCDTCQASFGVFHDLTVHNRTHEVGCL